MEKFPAANRFLSNYQRPEDELNTPEIAEIDQRSRKFNEEGGFKQLLGLKVAIDDITKASKEGFLSSIDFLPHKIQFIMTEPKRNAHELGLTPQEAESPEKLQESLKNFLDKKRIAEAAVIDRYLGVINNYEIRVRSEALNWIKMALHNCKEEALNGQWDQFCQGVSQIKLYMMGMQGLIRMCCGSRDEDEKTRIHLLS